MTDIKVGDRVKVTVESEVTYVSDQWITLHNDHEIYRPDEATTIEKVEPPVEVFKQGDIVRWKVNGVDVIILGPDRYTYLSNGRSFDYDGSGTRKRSEFTSEFYEKVTLVEPPL